MSSVVWKDLGWKRIIDEVAIAAKYTLEVGVVGDKAQEQHGDSDLTTGEVAIINEFGTHDGHVPARPFVKMTFERDQQGLVKEMAGGLKLMIESGVKSRTAFVRAGKYAADRIRKTIRSSVPPPNSPATLASKSRHGKSGRQSRRTLIDTYQMIKAVGYRLTRGDVTDEVGGGEE